MVSFQVDEPLNISCFGFTPADHFVFINVHQKDLTQIGSNYQNTSLLLIAKWSHIGRRTNFFYWHISIMIEIPMAVSVKNGYLAIVRDTKYNFLIFELFNQNVSDIEFVLE